MHLVRSSGNKIALGFFFVLFFFCILALLSSLASYKKKEDFPRSKKIEGHVIKEIETISSSYVPIKMIPIRKYQSVAKCV